MAWKKNRAPLSVVEIVSVHESGFSSPHARMYAASQGLPGSALSPQPSFPGAHDRLRPVRDLKLAEDVGDVVAHRLLADEEALRDLRVASP
jgi:hypothetical protein